MARFTFTGGFGVSVENIGKNKKTDDMFDFLVIVRNRGKTAVPVLVCFAGDVPEPWRPSQIEVARVGFEAFQEIESFIVGRGHRYPKAAFDLTGKAAAYVEYSERKGVAALEFNYLSRGNVKNEKTKKVRFEA